MPDLLDLPSINNQLRYPRPQSAVMERLGQVLEEIDTDTLHAMQLEADTQDTVKMQIADAVLADDWERARQLKESIASTIQDIHRDLDFYASFRENVRLGIAMWQYAMDRNADPVPGVATLTALPVVEEAETLTDASFHPAERVEVSQDNLRNGQEPDKRVGGSADVTEVGRTKKFSKRSRDRADADIAAILRVMSQHSSGHASASSILRQIEMDDPDAWLSITGQAGGMGMFTTRTMMIKRGLITGNDGLWIMRNQGIEFLREYQKKQKAAA